jgi:hypothetical protein
VNSIVDLLGIVLDIVAKEGEKVDVIENNGYVHMEQCPSCEKFTLLRDGSCKNGRCTNDECLYTSCG